MNSMGTAEPSWKHRSLLRASWASAILLRILFLLLGAPSLIGHRVEISTPVTSMKRLAEGYWLKQAGHSPYAGSVYHASPLLLAVLDCVAAFLLVRIGKYMECARSNQFSLLGLSQRGWIFTDAANLAVGDIAATVYLWNPFTIVSCVGGCTSPIENALVILSLFGAVAGNVPLSTFGWVVATHFSLYPAILIIPIVLTMAIGIDHPPKRLFKGTIFKSETPEAKSSGTQTDKEISFEDSSYCLNYKILQDVIIWSILWWGCVLLLCSVSLGRADRVGKMFSETYGFVLNVEDLSPNLGIFWYFFTEVFEFFRTFFLLVFHANVLFMILPLSIRLHHRPLFLAFTFCCITAMLKSYPSVGDAALYLGMAPLFLNELAGMRFTFFLLYGYVGIALLSPVMFNLWIWRGTGNANFYFAMALSYASIQLIMVVESVSTVLLFDRKIGKLKGVHGKK